MVQTTRCSCDEAASSKALAEERAESLDPEESFSKSRHRQNVFFWFFFKRKRTKGFETPEKPCLYLGTSNFQK